MRVTSSIPTQPWLMRNHGINLFRVYIFCFVLLVSVVAIRICLNTKKPLALDKRNGTWKKELVVPNTVHYILFGKESLDFVTFLSILSAIKVQRPENVFIHSDSKTFSGHYFSFLKLLPLKNLNIEVRYRQRPTHVYGQPLSSVYHASDVTRIQILKEFGGIYLDNDMLLLNNLNKYRHYEMVVGWPKGQFIGTQILLAKKGAPFLSLWLEGYKRYRPRDWYYNAGQFPTEQLVKKHPGLVHYEPVAFGVHNLASKLYGTSHWTEWHSLAAVHLLKRHPPAPQDMDEQFIKNYSAPFGYIARKILYEIEPPVTTVLAENM